MAAAALTHVGWARCGCWVELLPDSVKGHSVAVGMVKLPIKGCSGGHGQEEETWEGRWATQEWAWGRMGQPTCCSGPFMAAFSAS